MQDLKGKTLAGLFWSLSERAGIQVVQFIVVIFLARLLNPEQFGLIGMLALFIALAQTILDSGFGAALIQKTNATHLDECSIFYFNIFVGVLLSLALYFAAPLIAAFYNQPPLTALTRFLSLNILINAFGLIQTTLLARALRFKTQIKANLFAVAASGAVGIGAALLGFGVWSLAIQSVSNTLFRTVALWWICDWRPSLSFSLTSLRGMFGFGSRLLAAGLLNTFFDNLYQAFIGKAFSAASLGYYTRAFSMKIMAIDTTGETLHRVMYPALASIQNDVERLKRAYRKSMTLVTFVHFPLMLGLMVIARPLIVLLFSAKWEASVPLFQLMCVAGLLYPLQVENLEILKIKGRSDLFLKLEIIKKLMVVVSIFVTYRWGIQAMLTGNIVLTVISYYLNSYYSGRLINYPLKAQVLDVLPSLIFAFLMGGSMWLAGYLLRSSHLFIQVAVPAGVGAGSYLALQILVKSESLAEIVKIARQLRLPTSAI